jgi:hypothetical protein
MKCNTALVSMARVVLLLLVGTIAMHAQPTPVFDHSLSKLAFVHDVQVAEA